MDPCLNGSNVFYLEGHRESLVMDKEVYLSWCHLGCPRGVCWAHFYVYAILMIHISSSIKFYADDVLIIDTEDDCKMLRRDLDMLQSWAHKWNMSFNPIKYELLKITKRQNRTLFLYSIQDTSHFAVYHVNTYGLNLVVVSVVMVYTYYLATLEET